MTTSCFESEQSVFTASSERGDEAGNVSHRSRITASQHIQVLKAGSCPGDTPSYPIIILRIPTAFFFNIFHHVHRLSRRQAHPAERILQLILHVRDALSTNAIYGAYNTQSRTNKHHAGGCRSRNGNHKLVYNNHKFDWFPTNFETATCVACSS